MSCSKPVFAKYEDLLHDIFYYTYIIPTKQEYDESGIRRNRKYDEPGTNPKI